MVRIYYADSERFQKKYALKELLDKLPAEMRERARRYRRAVDAYNYVLGRLMLKKSLADWGLPAEKFGQMNFNEFDKPLIEGLHFNISHTANWVICAATDTGPVGIDIEALHDLDIHHLRYPFTDSEWAAIEHADDPRHQLLIYWTQKESILKATGTGLSGLEKIELVHDGLAYFGAEKARWYLYPLAIAEGVYGALCTNRPGEHIEIRPFDAFFF